MARFAVALLLLILALAPTASAEAQAQDSPAIAWIDALRGAWARLFSWVPAIRAEPREAGALIVPSGVTAPPPSNAGSLIVPSGVRSAPRKAGGLIVPSGISSVPRSRDNPRPRDRGTIQTTR